MGRKTIGLLLFGLGCLLVLRSGTGEASIGNIKEFLNTCPKNDPAYNQIKSDFTIRRNGVVVPMDGIACSDPVSSMPIAQYADELTILQGLRIIYYMDYGQTGHLPWTSGSLYPWMKSQIKGFHIDETLPAGVAGQCCENFPDGLYFSMGTTDDFNRNLDRSWKGIEGNIGFYTHEIRHLTGPPHDCEWDAGLAKFTSDKVYNPLNLSSFGTQWWLEKSWLNGDINVGYSCFSAGERQEIADWHLYCSNDAFRNRFCDTKPPLLTMPANPGGPCLAPPLLSWKLQTVASDHDFGQFPAIAIDPSNDIPYISYYDATHAQLRLASPVTSGGNCGPDSSWFCQTVDSNPNVGKYSSIGISSPGLSRELGISYVDDTNHTLKYYYDYCFLGACHQVIETVDSGLNPISYTSLKFDSNGIPHIAYLGSCGANCSRLKYARWVGSGGTCGTSNHWKCDQVDAGSNANYPSLDLDKSNLPRIAYYDAQAGDLRYAWKCGTDISCAHNCGPANDWGCDTLDSTGTPGLFPSLYIDKAVSNNPRIAYYDSTGKLKYASIPGGGDPRQLRTSLFRDSLLAMRFHRQHGLRSFRKLGYFPFPGSGRQAPDRLYGRLRASSASQPLGGPTGLGARPGQLRPALRVGMQHGRRRRFLDQRRELRFPGLQLPG